MCVGAASVVRKTLYSSKVSSNSLAKSCSQEMSKRQWRAAMTLQVGLASEQLATLSPWRSVSWQTANWADVSKSSNVFKLLLFIYRCDWSTSLFQQRDVVCYKLPPPGFWRRRNAFNACALIVQILAFWVWQKNSKLHHESQVRSGNPSQFSSAKPQTLRTLPEWCWFALQTERTEMDKSTRFDKSVSSR